MACITPTSTSYYVEVTEDDGECAECGALFDCGDTAIAVEDDAGDDPALFCSVACVRACATACGGSHEEEPALV